VVGRDVRGPKLSVYSIWESRYPPNAAEQGLEVTRAIWADMRSFDGYLDHEIGRDLDDHGHLFVISEWRDREAAAAALRTGRIRTRGRPTSS
jgi:quinol monooxygenase YgiN